MEMILYSNLSFRIDKYLKSSIIVPNRTNHVTMVVMFTTGGRMKKVVVIAVALMCLWFALDYLGDVRSSRVACHNLINWVAAPRLRRAEELIWNRESSYSAKVDEIRDALPGEVPSVISWHVNHADRKVYEIKISCGEVSCVLRNDNGGRCT